MPAMFGPLQATAFHSLKVVVPRLSIISIGPEATILESASQSHMDMGHSALASRGVPFLHAQAVGLS